MNARRQKLANWIALQTAAAAPKSNHDISDIRLFPIREPVSGRAYTVVRLRTSSGLTGWGEAVGSEEQKEARVDWVITKPFSAQRIIELTCEIAKRREVATTRANLSIVAA